ncbi:hypothetical protein LEP1GSC060_1649 [Leptospira weilii serovar Ranarum str. ICFT]|uniref:Uncharacterized protein n=1 Tax=Leptospira weilii serovar Ranarum str. ICFT TaxID=1218598 RepID=N1WB26_9LEPT|nr:hypothetical protein LEP1GSC060_1649 [Leptospira weilii serovar Ranarum str. ICFT]
MALPRAGPISRSEIEFFNFSSNQQIDGALKAKFFRHSNLLIPLQLLSH